LVDEGEIIGTPFACAIGAAASDWFDEFSPISATTLSLVISFVTADAASSARPWSSSTTSRIFRPSTPPAALISSAAMRTPCTVEVPKEA
jgi:hypothetical protein